MDPKNEEFIALIRSVGWSQAEVARQLGVSPPSVSQIFSGITRPSNTTLNLLKLAIAKHTGPEVFKLNETHGGMLDPWASDLIADLRRLPVSDRDKVLAAVRQLIKAYEGAATPFVYKKGKGK